MLDLAPFDRALLALERSLAVAAGLPGQADDDLRLTVRSGIVQDFAVAYEQAWKMIRRWLNDEVQPGFGDGGTRRELFRRAAFHGLIEDVDAWMGFHARRNESSHTYDLRVADEVASAAPAFLAAARVLAARLRGHDHA